MKVTRPAGKAASSSVPVVMAASWSAPAAGMSAALALLVLLAAASTWRRSEASVRRWDLKFELSKVTSVQNCWMSEWNMGTSVQSCSELKSE